MPGLAPGIHARRSFARLAFALRLGVDGRDKPGHDGGGYIQLQAKTAIARP